MKKVALVLNFSGRIILLLFISLLLGLLLYSWNAQTIAGNAMPMPFGTGVSVVLSGSMEPTLSVNDLVIVREAPGYEVGDIVVYQDGSSLVIHRIIRIDGELVTTKGDANNTADQPISRLLIKGRMAGRIPWIGGAVLFLKNPVGTALLLLAAIVLFELPYLKERKRVAKEQEKIKEEISRLKGE